MRPDWDQGRGSGRSGVRRAAARVLNPPSGGRPERERQGPSASAESDYDWDRAVVNALSAREALEQWKADQGATDPSYPGPSDDDPAPEAPPPHEVDPLLVPQDQMALQRGLVKIAQIARDQGQALAFLTAQLEQVEKRLVERDAPDGADRHRVDDLDDRLRRLEPMSEAVDFLRQAVTDLAARDRVQEAAAAAVPAATPELQQLRHEIAVAAERTVALDDRLTRLEQLRHDVSVTAQQASGLDERLTRLEDRTGEGAGGGPATAAFEARLAHLEELREGEPAGDDRVRALEDRLDRLEVMASALSQSLPGTVDDVVTQRFGESASDLLSLPGDVEGLYKELDRVAERVAARDTTVAAHLDRAAKLDVSVRRLREDVGQVIAGLAEDRQKAASPDSIKKVEERLDALESPEAEVDRLCRALRRLASQADGDADDGRPAPPSPAAVQSLSSELRRIKRSLEVLPGEDAGGR